MAAGWCVLSEVQSGLPNSGLDPAPVSVTGKHDLGHAGALALRGNYPNASAGVVVDHVKVRVRRSRVPALSTNRSSRPRFHLL